MHIVCGNKVTPFSGYREGLMEGTLRWLFWSRSIRSSSTNRCCIQSKWTDSYDGSRVAPLIFYVYVKPCRGTENLKAWAPYVHFKYWSFQLLFKQILKANSNSIVACSFGSGAFALVHSEFMMISIIQHLSSVFQNELLNKNSLFGIFSFRENLQMHGFLLSLLLILTPFREKFSNSIVPISSCVPSLSFLPRSNMIPIRWISIRIWLRENSGWRLWRKVCTKWVNLSTLFTSLAFSHHYRELRECDSMIESIDKRASVISVALLKWRSMWWW